MKHRARLYMACVLWVFPFFATSNGFLVEQRADNKLIAAGKRPAKSPEPDDFCAPEGYFEKPSDQKAYDYLNTQIRTLISLRNRYDAKIARLRDRADYYQFQRNYSPDADMLFDTIDGYEKIIEKINCEIAILQAQRTELLKRQKPFRQ
jgi:hypothetical protein